MPTNGLFTPKAKQVSVSLNKKLIHVNTIDAATQNSPFS